MKRYILSDLLVWKGSKSRKPLILYGARQIGKTYILKQFAEQEFCRYHYFNFEDQKQLTAIFDKDLNQ
jgi:predicted AAA+ superfamily ATPase